jgi:hypothetical protein
MRTFLGTVLGVIAIGVLLIAYGLLSPRVGATAPAWGDSGIADGTANLYPPARPMVATERVNLPDQANAAATPLLQIRCEPGQRAAIREVAGATVAECLDAVSSDRYGSVSAPVAYQPRAVPVSQTYPEPRRAAATRVRESSGRDWKKTALVIGGTTGAGAGIGAIFGGKKGALIGAAIGGGASSIYEARKR